MKEGSHLYLDNIPCMYLACILTTIVLIHYCKAWMTTKLINVSIPRSPLQLVIHNCMGQYQYSQDHDLVRIPNSSSATPSYRTGIQWLQSKLSRPGKLSRVSSARHPSAENITPSFASMSNFLSHCKAVF